MFVEIRRLKFVIHLYTEKSDFRGKTSAPCEFVLMEVDFSAV